LAWDVNGNGRTSIRASAGSFYDFPSNLFLQGFSNGAPFLPRFVRNNVDFQNPWANEPGGDLFPLPYGRWLGPNDARWPAYAGVTASYNGLVLNLERRAARGITLGANYTWSHCISDPGGAASIQGTGAVGYTNPSNRRADRGNCSTAGTDRRQIFNLSATAQT